MYIKVVVFIMVMVAWVAFIVWNEWNIIQARKAGKS